MAAAQAILDEIHNTPPRNADDTNSYVLGNIKRHNIVITCLSEGQYGTTNTATVVANLKRTFLESV
jgi:trimethylamine:corrinoid methyltransferase-like protein